MPSLHAFAESLQEDFLVRDGDVTAVPEPSSTALMLLGLMAAVAAFKRTRNARV